MILYAGLNYFHPHMFRSRAVVSFAPPLSIDKEDVEKFKRGGRDKRDAVTHVMDISDEAFKTVTINAPDYETLMVCFPLHNSLLLAGRLNTNT